MTLLTAGASAVRPPTGNQRPRLFTAPAAVTSAGPEAIDFAAQAGLMLDDWQQFVLTEALGERADGKWSAFEVGLIVSRQNGKGSILEARELAGLFLFGEELILHSAHEFKTASEGFRRVLSLIENTRDLDRRVQNIRTSHGEEGIELRPKPTIITGPGGKEITRSVAPRLRFIARSTTSGRGFTGDLLIYDEAMILDAEDVGATLPVLSARDLATDGGPQVWYAGSAGIGEKSTQLATIRHRVTEADRPPRSLCFMEWSADPHVEGCSKDCEEHAGDLPDDPETWAKANPALGIRITLDACERERDAMDDKQFGTERLGIGHYPMPKNGWKVISRKRWDAAAVPEADPPKPTRVAFCIDTTPNRSDTAIGLCGQRPDGLAQVELADHLPGTRWVIDRARELDREYRPVIWVIDPGGAARTFIGDLEAEYEDGDGRKRPGLKIWQPTARDVAAAFGEFYDGIKDGKVVHLSDRDFDLALAGAATRKVGDQRTWDRNAVQVNIAPICAVTLALAGHRKYARTAYDLLRSVVGPTRGDSWDDDDAPGWHTVR